MINIKRLHEVHYQYPNVPRKFGKTFYCYDRLLRTTQLGTVEEQFYITNTQRDVHTAFQDFMYFLSEMKEDFSYSLKDFTVFIGKCEIKFISLAGKERLKGNYSYFIEDYYEDGFRPYATERSDDGGWYKPNLRVNFAEKE